MSTVCERHKQMAVLESQKQTKDQIYQKLRWILCTCNPRRVWCDHCLGCAACLRCSKRDGTARNANRKYCTWCGGSGKCMECNMHGEVIKK